MQKFVRHIRYLGSGIGGTLLLLGCIESFPIETVSSPESILVVEATITNEAKQQRIVLSRSYALDQQGPNPETNAQIKVVDDGQNEYVFQETEPGTYVSSVPFSAQPGLGYGLNIVTSEGKSYGSYSQFLQTGAVIDSVYPVRELNDFGEDGIAVYLDATGPDTGSRYYRYTYEETYKIVAPFYVPQDAIVVNDEWPNFEYALVPRKSKQTCYGTRISNQIVLSNTDGQGTNNTKRFQVKFLQRDDYTLSHRYSILVKQYAQSAEAYAYYETLRDFSQSENPFSENQPGFFQGNVFSKSNPKERVIGFFDVAAVTTKRMFFNYVDFYPSEPLPPYPSFCSIVEPSPGCPGGGSAGCIPSMINNIREERLVFFDLSSPGAEPEFGAYQMVPFACGNCTKLGTNTVPDFWIE